MRIWLLIYSLEESLENVGGGGSLFFVFRIEVSLGEFDWSQGEAGKSDTSH